MVGPDLNTIRHALTLARKHGYDEVHLKMAGVEFSAKLSPHLYSTVSSTPISAEASEPLDREIVSPCVGIFKPSTKPLKAGQTVKVGDIVGEVTALGLPNEIESPLDGEVVEVCVKANDPVEYGQVIARIKVTS
jgi:acetyl-CoA carboxylase biotin carboxyl carrier protein